MWGWPMWVRLMRAPAAEYRDDVGRAGIALAHVVAYLGVISGAADLKAGAARCLRGRGQGTWVRHDVGRVLQRAPPSTAPEQAPPPPPFTARTHLGAVADQVTVRRDAGHVEEWPHLAVQLAVAAGCAVRARDGKRKGKRARGTKPQKASWLQRSWSGSSCKQRARLGAAAASVPSPPGGRRTLKGSSWPSCAGRRHNECTGLQIISGRLGDAQWKQLA